MCVCVCVCLMQDPKLFTVEKALEALSVAERKLLALGMKTLDPQHLTNENCEHCPQGHTQPGAFLINLSIVALYFVLTCWQVFPKVE